MCKHFECNMYLESYCELNIIRLLAYKSSKADEHNDLLTKVLGGPPALPYLIHSLRMPVNWTIPKEYKKSTSLVGICVYIYICEENINRNNSGEKKNKNV